MRRGDGARSERNDRDDGRYARDDGRYARGGRPDGGEHGPSEDLHAPLEGSARLGRNYLALLLPVLLVAAVVTFGFVGRQLAPERPGGAGRPQPRAAVAAATDAGPASSAPVNNPETLSGLTSDSGSVVAIGHTVFYVAAGRTIQAIPAGVDAAPEQIATVGQCQRIDGLAATENSIVYVISTVVPSATSTDPLADGCAPSNEINWAIDEMTLGTGSLRVLAEGKRAANTVYPSESPVHVAVSGDLFAYERPMDVLSVAATGAYELDVRSVSTGQLVWSTTVNSPIRSLMLGGTRLAFVTAGMVPQVYLADGTTAQPRLVSSVSTAASLSLDGRFLVYDSGEPAQARTFAYAMLFDVSRGSTMNLGNMIGRDVFGKVQPAIGSERNGSLIVAWFARLPDGHTGVRIVDRDNPDGAWLALPTLPTWMSVQGDDLVWLETTAQGTVARSLDLPTTSLIAHT